MDRDEKGKLILGSRVDKRLESKPLLTHQDILASSSSLPPLNTSHCQGHNHWSISSRSQYRSPLVDLFTLNSVLPVKSRPTMVGKGVRSGLKAESYLGRMVL